MHALMNDNWLFVKRILRYLKATAGYGLLISKSLDTNLNVYTDADWARNIDGQKSTIGFIIFMGKNLISWNSKKQQTVAKSSTEAEHMAISLAITEFTWIQLLLYDIGFAYKQISNFWCDNIGATYLSLNPVFHARSKYLEIDFHFFHDKVQNKEVDGKRFMV